MGGKKGAIDGQARRSPLAAFRGYVSMVVPCLTVCRVVISCMQWLASQLQPLQPLCLGSSAFSKLQDHEGSMGWTHICITSYIILNSRIRAVSFPWSVTWLYVGSKMGRNNLSFKPENTVLPIDQSATQPQAVISSQSWVTILHSCILNRHRHLPWLSRRCFWALNSSRMNSAFNAKGNGYLRTGSTEKHF